MDLPEFLLARIAEDEAVAEAGTPLPWESRGADVWCPHHQVAQTASWSVPTPLALADAAHIARHDPARVFAECDAKRRIVERCERAVRWDRDANGAPPEAVADWAWTTLELLALPFADHPDYDEAWRP